MSQGGEPLETLCPIWLARDLNPRPPTPETNALPLDLKCNLVETIEPILEIKQQKLVFIENDANLVCKRKENSHVRLLHAEVIVSTVMET